MKFNVYDLGRLFRHLLRIRNSESREETYKASRIRRWLQEVKEKKARAKQSKEMMIGQTTTKGNEYGLKFVVPNEVYSNPEYREYLNHAQSMKSVKVIVDEYYSKHGKRENL